MESKQKIAQYRERLDNTLASPELTNEEMLRAIVKNQLLRSSKLQNEGYSDNVLEKRTKEVSNFLNMLRSTSINDKEVSKTSETSPGEWKLKQDTEEFRVMYREGPQGTPFHTLLVEGYVDGPVDVCLCISWESALYKKWWPQSSIPPFKVTSCQCLQKVRIGEQISLVRVKVTWPLSAREALVHYFLFEYFQDDLIVVLVNTISDLGSIDISTYGFTNDGIPEAKDVVRIDLVGGFALQKVTPERSYFRTIANMDMKLDFVPPALINFISRQLIGNGFRLYQKEVASVVNCDEVFSKALGDPLYTQIREALYSINKSNETLEVKELKSDACILPEEHFVNGMQDGSRDLEQKVHSDDHASESSPQNARVTNKKAFGEIEEEGSVKREESTYLEEIGKGIELNSDACILPKEHFVNGMQDDMRDLEQKVHSDEHASESSPKNALVTDNKAFGEIEEEESENSEESTHLEEIGKGIDQLSTNKIAEKHHVNRKKNIFISHEVEQALGTLEKAISMVQEYGVKAQTRSSSGFSGDEPPNLEKGVVKNLTSLEDGVCSNSEVCVEVSKKETAERILQESRNSSCIHDMRRAGSNSYSREVNHNKIVPASPEQDLASPGEVNQFALRSSKNGEMEIPILDQTVDHNKHMRIKANGIHENSLNGEKLNRKKPHRFCCFGFYSGS